MRNPSFNWLQIGVFRTGPEPVVSGQADNQATKIKYARVKTARTIRKHRDGIDAAIDRGLSNGRQEGLNNKVRLIIRRAYGYRSAEAALATVMLACGPVNLKLLYHIPATHM
jgi:Transposase